jgi:hypothetical protein
MQTGIFHTSIRNPIVVILVMWLVFLGGSVVQDIVVFTTGTAEKIWILDVDSEDSLYTWLSTMLLCGAGLLAFVLSTHGDDAGKWRTIGFIMFAMSIDEMLSLHEKLSHILSSTLPTSGPVFFAWVIPAAILVIIVAVIFLPFVLRLPRRVATLIVIGAFIFVSGALGLEMVAGAFLSGEEDLTSTLQTPGYRIMTNLEEGLEGLGVIVFITALLIRCTQVFPASFADNLRNTRVAQVLPRAHTDISDSGHPT